MPTRDRAGAVAPYGASPVARLRQAIPENPIDMNTGTRSKTAAQARSAESEVEFEPMNHPGHLVRRLHQICVAVFMDAAKSYDLTHVQFAALMAIEHFPDIDQTRVGKIVALDRQTISIVVKRLSEKGLIERRQKDKRTNALHITGAGRALIDVMQARIQHIDDTILGPLADAEKEMFMTLLRKLVDHNNNLSRAPRCAEEQPQRAGEASEAALEQEQRKALPNRPAASQGKGKARKPAVSATRRTRQALA